MRFWFAAIHPETGNPLEIEACYEPAEPQTLEAPGRLDDVEICRVWNKAGEAVAFSAFEEELIRLGMRIARRKTS